jgi:hypothetical protein
VYHILLVELRNSEYLNTIAFSQFKIYLRWPKLEKLGFVYVDFLGDEDDVSFYADLRKALTLRSKFLPNLEVITIGSARHLREGQVDALRKYTNQLLWDDDEGFTEAESEFDDCGCGSPTCGYGRRASDYDSDSDYYDLPF